MSDRVNVPRSAGNRVRIESRQAAASGRVLFGVAALAVFGMVASPAVSGTHEVPTDFSSIQDAVDVSADGDSIVVGPGTYATEVTTTVSLTIVGAGPGSSTLTGETTHRIFDNVDADLILVGFTLTSATSSDDIPPTGVGGAIRMASNRRLEIENCMFRENRAGGGGAIYLGEGGELIARNSTFEDNDPGVQFPSVSIGGGVLSAFINTTSTFESCVFRRNRSGNGGCILSTGDLTIRDCTFEDNWANGSGGCVNIGGFGNTGILVENSRFARNRGSKGGGLHLTPPGPMTFRNCEFSENIAGLAGGAIAASVGGPVLIEDCDFLGNSTTTTAAQGGGAISLGGVGGGTIRDCYFKGNQAMNEFELLVGGGAMWLLENRAQGLDIEDCTFVENFAARGSVAMIQAGGNGVEFPRFEGCMLAYNYGGSILQCGLPTFPSAKASIDCSIVYNNDSNSVCAIQGPDLIVVEFEPTVPIFCDDNYDSICEGSIAADHVCGPVGGLPICGECLVPTQEVSWGTIKSRFRTTPADDAP